MKKLLIIGILLSSSMVSAQEVFQENVFAAELVLQNSFVISLTDQQEEKIKNIHNLHSREFRKIQWDLDEAKVNLKAMLKDTNLNPEAISDQWDKVLELENSLKKKQLLTLVAIKNELTETQQKELQELKGISKMSIPFSHGRENNTTTSSNTSPNVKLRLSADTKNSPLVLISTEEGMVLVDDFDQINPEDIQSLEVLKDKFYTDKFGDKAKDGLVIITLK